MFSSVRSLPEPRTNKRHQETAEADGNPPQRRNTTLGPHVDRLSAPRRHQKESSWLHTQTDNGDDRDTAHTPRLAGKGAVGGFRGPVRHPARGRLDRKGWILTDGPAYPGSPFCPIAPGGPEFPCKGQSQHHWTVAADGWEGWRRRANVTSPVPAGKPSLSRILASPGPNARASGSHGTGVCLPHRVLWRVTVGRVLACDPPTRPTTGAQHTSGRPLVRAPLGTDNPPAGFEPQPGSI